MRIAKRLDHIEASGIRRMFELGRSLKDPVDFSIGQPDFPPPIEAIEEAERAVRQADARYTVTEGSPELNDRLLREVRDRTGFRAEAGLVTSGVSGGLLLAYLALLDPGDEVLVPDPHFVLYRHLARLCGAIPRMYDLHPDFRFRAERIERALTPRTRFLVLNSPSNPTGTVATEREIGEIAELCRARGLFVVLDEIYDRFVYDAPFASLASVYDHVLVLRGFSKSYGMPGWRLGYACGPKTLLDAMKTLQQFTFVCAPSISQRAGLRALGTPLDARIAAYRAKRDLVWEGLRDVVAMVRPEGAFYAYPELPEGFDEATFVRRALEENVLLVPGSAFSERKTHFRVSYAVPDETIRRGIAVLRKIAVERRRASAT